MLVSERFYQSAQPSVLIAGQLREKKDFNWHFVRVHNQVRQVIGKSVTTGGKGNTLAGKLAKSVQVIFEPCKGSREGEGIGMGDEKIGKGVK